MSVQGLLESILGDDLPVRVSAYDGSSIGPLDAPATVYLRSPAALRRMIRSIVADHANEIRECAVAACDAQQLHRRVHS